jgi:hypothetical protein
MDIKINTPSQEEKKQLQSNKTSKFRRGKRRTIQKGYKKDQPHNNKTQAKPHVKYAIRNSRYGA